MQHADPRADDIMPERVYGWEFGAGKRKPSPWPALQAMHELQVSPEQTIMLDDLKPGVEMAIAAVRDSPWRATKPFIHCYLHFFIIIIALDRVLLIHSTVNVFLLAPTWHRGTRRESQLSALDGATRSQAFKITCVPTAWNISSGLRISQRSC